ncbi:response regulator [Sphingomonas crocodyli]|uniref:Response regulator n=1 Tax=Sphingomonas crocodyli TaxID=1979270 RepID=A0A437LYU0_9SPHN|nr:response regulator [Sphingomonas crocodyli]RVT90506.1 response regulator [Sphingomonas crocodyli]
MCKLSLKDRIIIVVEDEYYLAQDLTFELVGEGATVIGPAASVEQALHLIEATPHIDGAVVDIRLGQETVFAAVDQLRTRGVPILFATGYERVAIPEKYWDILRCQKPVGSSVVGRILATRIEAGQTSQH